MKSVMKAVFLGSIVLQVLMLPAAAQQEVDPAWYDPWVPAPKTAPSIGTAKPGAHKTSWKNNPAPNPRSGNNKLARKAKAANLAQVRAPQDGR